MTAIVTQPGLDYAANATAAERKNRAPAATGMALTKDMARLRQSLRYAEEVVKPFRMRQTTLVAKYANIYGGSRPTDAQPINLFYGLATAMLPPLSIEPSCNVAEKDLENAPDAHALMHRINDVFLQADLKVVIDEILMNSLFGAAICYTNLAAAPYIEDSDVQAVEGVFFQAVSIHDYIFDPFALRRPEMRFEGHKVRFDFEWAMDQRDMFNRKLLERIGKMQMDPKNRGRADEVGKQILPHPEDRFVDEVELYSLFIPGTNPEIRWVSSHIDGIEGYVGRADWKGPPGSNPYDALNFMRVPDNTQPTTVMSQAEELHDCINKTARKVQRQTDNQKDLIAYENESDGKLVKEASDGDVLHVMGKVWDVHGGGPNDKNLASIKFLSDWFNYIAGNPESFGGEKKQSDTATQDTLLHDSAMGKLTLFRGRVLDLVRNVAIKAGHFELNDRTSEHKIIHQVGDRPEIDEWLPEHRQDLTVDDFIITAKSYGIQSDTPEKQYGRIMDVVQKYLLPVAPMLMQSGKSIDWAAITKMVFDKAGLPHADRLVIAAQNPQVAQDQASQFAQGIGGGPGGSQTINAGRGTGGGGPMASVPATGGNGTGMSKPEQPQTQEAA